MCNFLRSCSVLLFLSVILPAHQRTFIENEMIKQTEEWVQYLSRHLPDFSEWVTRRDKSINSFKTTRVIKQNGTSLLREISGDIMKAMRNKENAIRRIKAYAEFLSLNRDSLTKSNASYDFFDSGITNKTSGLDGYDGKDIDEGGCRNVLDLLDRVVDGSDTLSSPLDTMFREDNVSLFNKSGGFFNLLNVEYDPHFDEDVNLNYSVVHRVTNVYGKEENVLSNIRWSEELDLVFRCNYMYDRTLTWQYFASSSGFMRLYPAIEWSKEKYDVTYDFRMRSWYAESMALPKDMIILMDSSGSMHGKRRKEAYVIMQDILDTLTDNDYINVYLFNNNTIPLVDCFNDTLVQANEENLRLIRESLPNYNASFPGNLSLGFQKAFELLKMNGKRDIVGTKCNKVIMVITEGLDYYNEESHRLLDELNEPDELGCKMRIFTYQLGTEESDATIMRRIACDNLGYYVNVSSVHEIREKVVKYLSVMSRSTNLKSEPNFQPIWTPLYVDIADRRLTNFLWEKEEGLKQREIFINIGKAHSTKNPYAKYRIPRNYTFLTTVSLPVYDKKEKSTVLLGVAAVDVPTSYFRKLTKEYLLGVNGYAFILTNNGYVLMHPDHRPKFKNILKPTFNRVDLTEVELSSDTREPRNFDEKILKLRENIVTQKDGEAILKVMTHMDDMRRIYFGRRLYFYTPLEPYSLIIALPDKYGLLRVKYASERAINWSSYIYKLRTTKNWVVHPDWLYFENQGDDPHSGERLINHMEKCKREKCNPDEYYELLYTFLQDFMNTQWFDDNYATKPEDTWRILSDSVTIAFLATHSGLTRWKNLVATNKDPNHFSKVSNKTVDEMWYKRTVEENYNDTDNDNFIFSTALDIEEFNDTEVFVTVTNALFRKYQRDKVPVAVIGYEIQYGGWRKFFDKIKCGKFKYVSEEHPTWSCLVLDNHGYVVFSDNDTHVGRLILDINKNLTDRLEEDGVFESVNVFDYQGICFKRLNSSKLCPPSGHKKCRQSKDKYTLQFEKLAITKTIPTPCDKEIRLYRYRDQNYAHFPPNDSNCTCPYIARGINKTNLVLLIVSNNCCELDIREELNEVYPQKVLYNVYGNDDDDLPCYIQRYNNYNERSYIKSIPIQEREKNLNANVTHCGGNQKNVKDEL